MLNPAFKSLDLLEILHYNSHAEVSISRSSHYNVSRFFEMVSWYIFGKEVLPMHNNILACLVLVGLTLELIRNFQFSILQILLVNSAI